MDNVSAKVEITMTPADDAILRAIPAESRFIGTLFPVAEAQINEETISSCSAPEEEKRSLVATKGNKGRIRHKAGSSTDETRDPETSRGPFQSPAPTGIQDGGTRDSSINYSPLPRSPEGQPARSAPQGSCSTYSEPFERSIKGSQEGNDEPTEQKPACAIAPSARNGNETSPEGSVVTVRHVPQDSKSEATPTKGTPKKVPASMPPHNHATPQGARPRTQGGKQNHPASRPRLCDYPAQWHARRCHQRSQVQTQISEGISQFLTTTGKNELALSLPTGQETLNYARWVKTNLTNNEMFTYVIGLARGAHPISFEHLVRSGVPAGLAARRLLSRHPSNSSSMAQFY
jgi:hypothetical protein